MKYLFPKRLITLFFLLLFSIKSISAGNKGNGTCSGPSGIISVGPTGAFTTLTAALATTASGISGPVIFELQAAYTSTAETFPITMGTVGCAGSGQTITIRPEAGANGLVIISSNAGPTIDFSGSSYVIIDGRPGGVGSSISVTAAGSTNATNLNIINTNAAGAAIRMDNQSSYNNIIYCDLQGQNTTAANVPTALSGVVYFGNNGAGGNDNNIIDHCNIHSSGSGTTTPSIGIYSLGYDNQSATAAYATQFNDNNTISNNNIYDFYSNANSVGIEANYGNTGWSITGNSFFQTSAIIVASSSSSYNRAIWLIPYRGNFTGEVGNGFDITGNYIGGSQPSCGGSPYTFSSGTAGYFEGIRLELADAATPLSATSVQGNTIANISITSSTSSDAMHGINLTSGKGNVNVGTITGNTIGTATGTSGSASGGITIAASAGVPNHMIIIGGTYTINVKNNTIGNVLLTQAGSYFSGIFTNTAITGNFSNNTITNITASSTGTTSGRYINAIQVGSGAPTLTITNNTIAGLTCNYLYSGSSLSQVVGINIASTSAIVSGGITGNTIKNLYNASSSTGTLGSSAIIGIAALSTVSSGCTVSQNTIDSLVSGGSTGAVNVMGIYYSGTTSVTNNVSKNFIHSFSGTNASAILTGIHINAGTSSFTNNMIRLGINPDGTSIATNLTISGITSVSTSANSFYNNSIYIGGTGVGSTATNTFAFRRTGTSGTYDIRNNILVNNRSNATTGGKHYTTYFTTSNTGATVNYNVYQYSGTGGIFGYSGTADIASYTAGGVSGWVASDLNSFPGDPQFINPAGSIGSLNLHINPSTASWAESTGTNIASVTDDFDGQTRSGLTPVDIGADAGNFIAYPTCVAPNAATGLLLNAISSSQINGSFTASSGGADGYLVVKYAIGAPVTSPIDGTNYTVGTSLGAGTIVAVGSSTSFSSTSLLASTSYTYYVYSYNNSLCLGGVKYAASISGTQSTLACSGPSGTITVGASATYTTLTAALASLSSGMGGAVVLELQSNYVSTSETYPITINSSACLTPTNTITIRPASGANGLAITGTNAGPTIDLIGANYVTIDGRPGGTGSSIAVTASGNLNAVNLNITNTNAAGAAIRLDNQASNNTIKFCDLQGQSTVAANVPTALAGVVYFGNNGTAGNDNNTIDYCNIHSTGTNMPSIAVYALGATNAGSNVNFNDNDIVSNSNIYDFFAAGGNSAGIELNQGVNAWTITGNSFFQTGTRTFTAAGYNRAIWAIPNRTAGSSVGNGFIITNNYIGGSAPLAAGTAYTLTAQANYFDGIRLEVADGTVANASSIQGNTITNLSITSTITSANDVFHGIAVTSSNANVNIGTVTGNIIGSSTGNDAITIAAGSGSHSIALFISNSAASSSSVINVKGNTIGGITMPNLGSNFSGIFDNQLGTVNIDGNTIGSTTVSNSINASNTTTTSQFVRAINISSGAGTINITNNSIANLTNATTSTTSGAQVAGIYVGTTPFVPLITGNTIFNLSCAAAQTGGGSSATVGGILYTTTAAAVSSITGNKVYALKSTSASTSTAILMEGIFVAGPTANAVNITKNFVHSFDVAADNPSLSARAIEFSSGTGTVVNNMVRLGIQSDGTNLATAAPLFGILKGGTGVLKIYYNSVYVGGAVNNTTANASYAFRRSAASGVDDIRNNIFYNERSNSTTGGTHYAISFTTTATDATLNNNVYGYTGTGGVFAYSGTADVATYSASWTATDVNSFAANPQFVNAIGNSTALNLHINTSVLSAASDAGVAIAGYTDDYDGDTRFSSTPDIGADEFATTVTGYWTGNVSSDYDVAGNWSDASVPTASSNITIPTGATNMPVLSTNRSVKNITLQPSATLNLNGKTYTVAGNIGGTGLLKGSTSSILVLNGTGSSSLYFDQTTNGTTNALHTLTVNGSGAIVSLSNKLYIYGYLYPTLGTLATGGNLTMKSTSITNTALVGTVGGTISGNVTVERFIPASQRSFRFLTPGVTSTGSIKANWQEGQNNTSTSTNNNSNPGYGTHITGSSTGLNGFDATSSGGASMYTFSNNSGQTWSSISNTNSNILSAGTAYRTLIRGSRAVDLNTNTPTIDATTLRATGALTTGTVVFNSTGTGTNVLATPTISGTTNDYSFIGNPYWAPVDWDALSKTNMAATYYSWDPTKAGTNNRGGYVSYTTGSGASGGGATNQYLQPGQAVFVQTTGTGPSISFTEANKAASNGNLTTTFRTTYNIIGRLDINLYLEQNYASKKIADAAAIVFSNDFSKAIDKEDADKFGNPDENISVKINGKLLGLNGTPMPQQQDTMWLNMQNMLSRNYMLEISGEGFTSSFLEAYLIDTYLHTRSAIKNNDAIAVNYSIDNNPLSSANNRFAIVFEKTKLPVLSSLMEIKVSPNPASDVLTINYNGLNDQEATSIRIMDMGGKVIMNIEAGKLSLGKQTIHIKNWSNGAYTMQLINGRTKQSQTFIKQ